MPLSHVTKLYGVNDAAVYSLTTDPAGQPPTFGSKMDVPGVKSLTCQFGLDMKELRGDMTLLAADSVFKEVKGDLKYAKLSLDVLGVSVAGTVTDSGTTPAQKSIVTLSQTNLPQYYKTEGQSKQVDYIGGDVHFILFKCMPSTIDMTAFAQEDYQIQTLSYTAVPLVGTIASGPPNAWVQAIANETAAAIV